MKRDLHPLLLDNGIRGLVFDLDGTLIDSATDIIEAMRRMFADTGIGALPDGYFPENLHGTTEGIIRWIAAEMGWPLPDDVDALARRYVQIQLTMPHRSLRLYEGVVPVLEACRDAGLALGICTNKSHAGALAATDQVGIQGLFDFITGADSWAEAKPSPVPLLETIRMLKLEPHQCLYFGDTSVDAECARAADVRFVLYESGYGDPALADLPRHHAFRHWNDMWSACAKAQTEEQAG